MRMARKAVIAEIRHNGRKVNSIAPEELGRLIGEYLKEHPEEMVGLYGLGMLSRRAEIVTDAQQPRP
jgi:hypothetical protein